MTGIQCTECGALAIVSLTSPKHGRVFLCAAHARLLFKEGLKSLPHHDLRSDGTLWFCAKCGETSAQLSERLQLERCPAGVSP